MIRLQILPEDIMFKVLRSISTVFLLFTFVHASSAFSQDAKPASNEAVVDLKNGDRVQGELTDDGKDEIVVVSPVFGTVTLSRDQINEITMVAPVADEDADAKKKADDAADAVAAVEKPKSPWTGSVNLGLTYSDNSTTNLTLNLGASAKRETKESVLTMNVQYFYSKDEDKITDNDVIASIDQTWIMSDKDGPLPWSYFAQGTYQWDQFENWEQRVSPYAGIGYALRRTEALTVDLRFGGGGTWQYDGNDGFRTQFLFEVNSSWMIDDRSSLTGAVKFAPNVNDFQDYLLTVSAVYKAQLMKDSPLTFNVSFLNIYDSDPGVGENGNDLKLVFGLGFNF
jgi:putative salt-induced outer membrane protein YdiY